MPERPEPPGDSAAPAAAPEQPAGTAAALHEHGSATGYETTVEAPAPTSAASAESIRDRDLQLRPRATPQDILRVVPGLVIAQHQGGGKADQLFLRGFDADHGTDVALSIDGIPINLPSHAHGQGYADLNFLVPEAIDRVDVLKGPYFVEVGDFATAGAVNLRTRRAFAENMVQATYGSFQTWRALGVGTTGVTSSPTWMAAEVAGTQGPFQTGEDLRRYNLFLKSTLQLSSSTRLSILGSAYGSSWRASGQIPSRFTELPEPDPAHLDRFGSIDPTEGGQTQRQMLAVTVDARPSDFDELNFTAYLVHYRLALFNDFTFQQYDAANFDEIEQDDARVYTGLNATYRRRIDLGTIRTVTTLGAQARMDSISVGLWHVKQRVRLPTCAPIGNSDAPALNPCDSADVVQSNLAAFLQEDVRFAPWFRMLVGVRGDLFEWNVTDTRPEPGTGGQGTAVVQRGIVNPKLQAILTPTTGWDVFFDGGGGFHSNDARAVVKNGGSGALPRAWGGEIGTRLSLLDRRLDLATTLWFIHLQSELVFDADIGGTEPSGPTDRYGVDLEARYRILPWMWADLDLTLAHAEYTQDAGNAVALAPTFTGQAGLSVLHPAGWRGRLGARWVGSRPATQNPNGLQAEGYFIVDLSVAYRWRYLELGVVVENLLNSAWREAQFANTSYVVGRDNPAYDPRNGGHGVQDIVFTPGNPISVRGTVAVYF
ncbi:MAG TPA: TonB-dependent receptor [Myxococcaceae bacterium]|jgi:outer membrane receptor protein involved in Fe transport